MTARGRSDTRKRVAPDAPAEIEVGAAVKARTLRFHDKPETEISFPESDEQRSGSHTERRNLPDEVEPGVTYRDVEVRWQAAAGLEVTESERLRSLDHEEDSSGEEGPG